MKTRKSRAFVCAASLVIALGCDPESAGEPEPESESDIEESEGDSESEVDLEDRAAYFGGYVCGPCPMSAEEATARCQGPVPGAVHGLFAEACYWGGYEQCGELWCYR